MSQSATVMLVGASGVGKSTLGNYLLKSIFDNYLLGQDPGGEFQVGGGSDPVTTRCEAQEDYSDRATTFRVIDTPGMPDPEGNTSQYFNSIVEGAREAGTLNALVLVIEYAADRNHLVTNYENASILLEQFSKLGCTVIIGCRVPGHLPGRDKSDLRDDVNNWTGFVNDISAAAGLDPVAMFLMDTAGMVSHARDLRSSIVQCPAISVRGDRGMKTVDEMQRSLQNRVDQKTRRDQLAVDVTRLERENKELDITASELEKSAKRCSQAGDCISVGVQSIAMSVDVGAMGALVFVPSLVGAVLGLSAQQVGSTLQRMKERDASLKRATVAANLAAVNAMRNELVLNGIDSDKMTRDEQRLRKLENFLGNVAGTALG